MSLKRIGITALAVLALALMGIGTQAQVVLLPGYGSYNGFMSIGGYNPLGGYNGYNPYGIGDIYNGYENPYLYNGLAGYGSYGYGNYGYYGPYGPNMAGYNTDYHQTAIPRTNDSVVVRKQAKNKVYMSWQGDNAMVSSITFALLDKNGKVLTEQTITSPPAEMTLTRTSKSAYAQIVVNYINGTTSSFLSPL